MVNAAHPRRVSKGLTTAGGQTVAPTAAQARSRFQPLLIAVSSPTSDARFRRVSDYPNVASGFVPKTWEEREVLIPDHLVESLRCHKAAANPDCPWIFPSANGCVSYHFLSECKRIAWRTKLNCGTCHTKQGHCHRGPYCANWFLHKFRATYATNQLRAGTDIRTLQVWMGHKDLASTMRYLKAGYGKDLLARVNQAFAVVTGVEEQRSQERSTSAGAANMPPSSDQSGASFPP